ncbi:MAG: anhydro-N-acetylmuramic acid kinase [Fluviicola sp.]|nr:MAG: anhydro-N-acetylmuramic acid kinase [Fluviicola sp.]
MQNSYRIIGIMSGTSMDGVDIAYTSFSQSEQNSWTHEIKAVKTFPYTDKLLEVLKDSVNYSAVELSRLDKHLGTYFGHLVNHFIDEFKIDTSEVHAIASHGHTIFHQPENGFTLQIGCGSTIASLTNIKVINDFRTKDVINGGQGAPLAPIGDTLLFSDLADAFLNIGGFANVCINTDKVIAFDIGPGNLPLNEICQEDFNRPFDKNGEIAQSGKLRPRIFEILNTLDYYSTPPPRSMGTEWLEEFFRPLITSYSSVDPRDLLHTVTAHIAYQISANLNEFGVKSVLITGGGAKNKFLIDQITEQFKGEVIIPGEELIDFKEAIIFGFLGALYLDGQPNTIPSVTGAKKAVSGGVLHTP